MKRNSATNGLVVATLALTFLAATSVPLWATVVTSCTTSGDCDDFISCTDDTCDASGDCQYELHDDYCDDGVGCTDDTCDATGDCQHIPDDEYCDDGVGCTDDTCDATGDCQNIPNDEYCNDGVACTDDTCSDATGDCENTPNNANCDDSVACTTDLCDPNSGCVNTPDNGKCDDGVACTHDTCDGTGGCQNTPDDALCDDSNVCTTDVCDPSKNCSNPFVDSDDDGICDAEDPHPSEFDPTGCLYDEATGRVIPGGLVIPSGPGTIVRGLTGASGCYQFSVTGLPADPNSALYALSIELPPNCVRSTTCLEDPNAPLDPTGHAEPYVLGPYDVGGYINPHDCASNPFFLSFELSDGDPAILNNNIPLSCEFVAPPVPAPAMSPWAIAVALLLLMLSAFVALRVRRNER